MHRPTRYRVRDNRFSRAIQVILARSSPNRVAGRYVIQLNSPSFSFRLQARLPIWCRMNITGSAPVSLLESVLEAQSTRFEIGVAVLDKAQEVQQQQGEAMIRLIEQAAPAASPAGLDTYA